MTNTVDSCSRCGAPHPGPVCMRCGLRINPVDLKRWSSPLPLTGLVSPYGRYYLRRDGPGNTVASPVKIPFDPLWNDTSQVGTVLSSTVSGWRMTTARDAIPNAAGPECLATVQSTDTAGRKIALAQYISDRLVGGVIKGTCKGQMRFVQDTPSQARHDRAMVSLRVMNEPGTVTRGSLLPLNFYGTTNSYADSAGGFGPTNRFLANGDALSQVTSFPGDRLVLEIGSQTSLGSIADGLFVCLYCGDDSATDLPEDEVETQAFNPWFQLTSA